MMKGRRHSRPLHGKARAMACGGKPRALPDFGVYIGVPLFWETTIYPSGSSMITIG